MTIYTRNDVWRLKRTLTHLDKALDSLTRSSGELRPKQFATFRKQLEEVVVAAEVLQSQILRVVETKPTFDLDEAAE